MHLGDYLINISGICLQSSNWWPVTLTSFHFAIYIILDRHLFPDIPVMFSKNTLSNIFTTCWYQYGFVYINKSKYKDIVFIFNIINLPCVPNITLTSNTPV